MEGKWETGGLDGMGVSMEREYLLLKSSSVLLVFI